MPRKILKLGFLKKSGFYSVLWIEIINVWAPPAIRTCTRAINCCSSVPSWCVSNSEHKHMGASVCAFANHPTIPPAPIQIQCL